MMRLSVYAVSNLKRWCYTLAGEEFARYVFKILLESSLLMSIESMHGAMIPLGKYMKTSSVFQGDIINHTKG